MRYLFNLLYTNLQKFKIIACGIHSCADADRKDGLVDTVSEILTMHNGDVIFRSDTFQDLIDLGIFLCRIVAED